MGTIKLGDRVRDPISGFEGVAISSHHYLYGCVRISIQPLVGEDGKYPDSQAFDEPQLEVMESAEETPIHELAATGGPDKYMDTPRR